MYFEEGVNHGKRADNKTLSAMVMGCLEVFIFHGFYNVLLRGCESRIWSCLRSGLGNVDISCVL